MVEICLKKEVTEQSFYRWRLKYAVIGGADSLD